MSTGRSQFKKFKFIIIVMTFFVKLFPKAIRVFMWDCIGRYSQVPFIAFRYILLRTLCNSIGDNIRIGKNVTIISWEKLYLGNNISIHDNCYIDAEGGIEISDNVSIAHNTSLLSSNHDWKLEELPIKYNPIIKSKLRIEDDVWIGCGCRILAGVKIQRRSIVAAGAVVNKDVDSRIIVGGIPAKLIKRI